MWWSGDVVEWRCGGVEVWGSGGLVEWRCGGEPTEVRQEEVGATSLDHWLVWGSYLGEECRSPGYTYS